MRIQLHMYSNPILSSTPRESGIHQAAAGKLLHGLLAPSRFSPGRPHCVIPYSYGAVTGREYHCVLWGSSHLAGATCLSDETLSLASVEGHGASSCMLQLSPLIAKVPDECVFSCIERNVPSLVRHDIGQRHKLSFFVCKNYSSSHFFTLLLGSVINCHSMNWGIICPLTYRTFH